MAKKPTDVELAVQKVTGMQPGLDRASLLPFYTDKSGRNYLSAPQFVYDAAKAFVTPGVAARGGKYDVGDVANMAFNVTGAGLGASRVAGPTVRAGERVLGMGVGPKPPAKPKPAQKEAEKARKLTEQGLYSHAAEMVAQLPQAKGTPQQMEAMLRKYGVKPDELKHSGFTDAFGNRPSVTKDELAAHFENELPALQETMLGGEASRLRQLQLEIEQQRTIAQDLELQNLQTGAWGRNEGLNSPTKFSEYTVPGGENYRELLLRLPRAARNFHGDHWDDPNVAAHLRMADRTVPTTPPEDIGRNIALKYGLERGAPLAPESMGSGILDMAVKRGWVTPQEAATYGRHRGFRHTGMEHAPGAEQKLLHLEELQSDWGQAGRKHGFSSGLSSEEQMEQALLLARNRELYERMRANADNDAAYNAAADERRSVMERLGVLAVEPRGVPNAPYIGNTNSWTDLGLKRALTEAARGGQDKLIWTPGAAQAERYGLSKYVQEIHHMPNSDGTYNIAVVSKNGDEVSIPNSSRMSLDDLQKTLGTDVAEQIKNNEGRAYRGREHRTLEGMDLKVGGEGMKGYYDTILPKRLMALAREHNPEASLEDMALRIKGEGYDPKLGEGYKMDAETLFPALTLSPEMRESILNKGFKAYAGGGLVEKYGV
jgi:hypothetical protein